MGEVNFALVFAVLAAALGSAFQHGYHTGVMNQPEKVVEEWINETFEERGNSASLDKIQATFALITSIYSAGGMIGALLIGVIADLAGRKWAIILNNILVIIPVVIIFLCKDPHIWELLVVARFILGLNSGFNSGVCPLYLNEISPIKIRGAIGSIYQLVITISILVAQILGIDFILGNDKLWTILLGLCLVPCVFQIIAMPFCPETPRYLLILKNNEEKATKSLKWLRRTDDVQGDIDDMNKEAAAALAAGSAPWKHLFTKKFLRTPLIISLVVMMAQQLSGINAIIFYSTEIFQFAGLSHDHAAIGTVAMGTVNVLMTIASVFLVDIAGRKTLLLIGFAGTTIFMTLMMLLMIFITAETKALNILCIIFVIGYIISFATGPGSIPWFLFTELFRQDARPKAAALAVFSNWLMNFLVGYSFLPLKNVMKHYVFAIYIVIQVLFIVFTIFVIPETKNKPIDEIVAGFGE